MMQTKKCCKCKSEKDLCEFNRNKSRKDGCSGYCKQCNDEYQKQHYLQNKTDYQDNKRSFRKKLTNAIAEIKSKASCVICGENHPAVLEFHHKDATEKDFAIAEVVRLGYNLAKLMEEINKCEILCSNCHKKKHWEEKILGKKK